MTRTNPTGSSPGRSSASQMGSGRFGSSKNNDPDSDEDDEIVIVGEKVNGVFQPESARPLAKSHRLYNPKRHYVEDAPNECHRRRLVDPEGEGRGPDRKKIKLEGARKGRPACEEIDFHDTPDRAASDPRANVRTESFRRAIASTTSAGSTAPPSLPMPSPIPSMSSSSRKTKMPFLDDDSDTDTRTPTPPPTPPPSTRIPQYHSEFRKPVLSAAQKDAARGESRRLRNEALARRSQHAALKSASEPKLNSPKLDSPKLDSSQMDLDEPAPPARTTDVFRYIQQEDDSKGTHADTTAQIQDAWRVSEAARGIKARRERVEKPSKEADKRNMAERQRKGREKLEAEWAQYDASQKLAAMRRPMLQREAMRQSERDAEDARTSALTKLQDAAKKSAQMAKNSLQSPGTDLMAAQDDFPRSSCGDPSNPRTPQLIHGLPNSTGGVAHATTSQSQAQQRRIKEQMERIERNRQAEEAERQRKELEQAVPKVPATVTPADVGAVSEGDSKPATNVLQENLGSRDTPLTSQAPKGPVSLNSVVGQRRIAQAGIREKASRAGEIGAEDIQLVKWRDAGKTYAEITTLFQHRFGTSRSLSALYSRYRLVTELFEAADVPKDLFDRAHGGDEEARGRINLLVHQGEPLPVGNVTWTTGHNRKRKDRKLGAITPHDIRVLIWKDDKGLSTQEIKTHLEENFGVHYAASTISKRLKQVRDALAGHSIDDTLLEAVSQGDEMASRTLNDIIDGEGMTVRSSHGFGGFACGSTVGNAIAPPERATRADSPVASSSSSRTLIYHESEHQRAAEIERSEVGGKTLNQSFWKYLIEQKILGGEEAEETASEDEDISVTEEDRCHLAFQVQRRQITADEVDDGVHIDSLPWITCGDAFDDLSAANTAATRHIFRTPPGCLPVYRNGDGFQLESKTDEDKVSLILDPANGGQVEVRVFEFLRSYEAGHLPRNSANMIERTAYIVLKETGGREDSDELFGQGPEKMVEAVDDNVYTALEFANDVAVKAFVKAIFRSNSSNLNVREAEKQELERHYLNRIDDDEYFDQEDERKDLRIWVEERRIVGPRNIL